LATSDSAAPAPSAAIDAAAPSVAPAPAPALVDAAVVDAATDAANGAPDCRRDSDCVPATCCHATRCTPRAKAPACNGVMCTLDVRPGTLDMGRCVCRNAKCIADIAKVETPFPSPLQ
jgi:hypothetical protein